MTQSVFPVRAYAPRGQRLCISHLQNLAEEEAPGSTCGWNECAQPSDRGLGETSHLLSMCHALCRAPRVHFLLRPHNPPRRQVLATRRPETRGSQMSSLAKVSQWATPGGAICVDLSASCSRGALDENGVPGARWWLSPTSGSREAGELPLCWISKPVLSAVTRRRLSACCSFCP